MSYSTELIYYITALFLLTPYNVLVPVGCALMQNAVTHFDYQQAHQEKKKFEEKYLRDHV